VKAEDIRNIAVIGAGEMGHGIAQAALMAGIPVNLYDTKEEYLDRGVQRIYNSLDKFLMKNKITNQTYEFCKTSLNPTTNLENAVRNVQFVIEAVPEVFEIKKDVFKKLAKSTSSNTILASNTSNMSISEIAKEIEFSNRIVGVHFFNPVVLMKLVEVIRGEQSSDEAMEISYDLCKRLDKVPVRVEKDSPGFIVNRINAPARVYLGSIVDNGYSTPEEIDSYFKKQGDPMGPFELIDYVGADTVYYSSIYRADHLHPDFGPFKSLEEKIKNGELGKKTGKGFYDWSQGRPTIDLTKNTDQIDRYDIQYIKLNEGCKLIEEGIATAKDIDTAMVLGTSDKKGPFETCKDFNADIIINRLNHLADKYNKEIFRPTKLLENNFKSIINVT